VTHITFSSQRLREKLQYSKRESPIEFTSNIRERYQ
jgi:hypothetical protein